MQQKEVLNISRGVAVRTHSVPVGKASLACVKKISWPCGGTLTWSVFWGELCWFKKPQH